MKDNQYPTKVVFYGTVGNGTVLRDTTLINSEDAIKIEVSVNSGCYSKKDVQEVISEICQKVLECYGYQIVQGNNTTRGERSHELKAEEMPSHTFAPYKG